MQVCTGAVKRVVKKGLGLLQTLCISPSGSDPEFPANQGWKSGGGAYSALSHSVGKVCSSAVEHMLGNGEGPGLIPGISN